MPDLNLLIVCTANICRSPVAEACFRAKGLNVSSAGLYALVGRDTDPPSRAVAEKLGVECPPHAARQFDDQIGQSADIILVMDRGHRRDIMNRWPQFLGKTFLLGQFSAERDIPDPHKQGDALYYRSAEFIMEDVGKWIPKLDSFST